MKYVDRFRVKPGSHVKLAGSCRLQGHHESHKKAADEIEQDQKKLRALQDSSMRITVLAPHLPSSDGQRRQGRHHQPRPRRDEPAGLSRGAVQAALPRGARARLPVAGTPATPRRGEVTIFNRSHYEDVLVVRVHNLVPKDVWSSRYDQINAFEQGCRERHAHPQVLSPHLQGRAAESLRGAARRPGQAMEDQRSRLQGAGVLGRVHGRLRRRAIALQHRAGALVRHPVRPQVVPQPRRRADRHRVPRSAWT